MGYRTFIAGALVTAAAVVGATPANAISVSKCQTEEETLLTAAEAYYFERGTYPNSAKKLVPRYLKRVPKHYGIDASGNPFPKGKGCY